MAVKVLKFCIKITQIALMTTALFTIAIFIIIEDMTYYIVSAILIVVSLALNAWEERIK